MNEDENNANNVNGEEGNKDNTNSNQPPANVDPANPEALIKKGVEEALKPMKEKLDKAYSARDEALRKVAAFEEKERQAEITRLQEEGKHREAFEMQLAEERAQRENLEKQNIALTRDIEIRNALGAQPFRNDNALEMVYREIVTQVVRNEQGVWVHKSGVSVRDFVKAFADNEDNAFLFRQKQSSGANVGSQKSGTPPAASKSIFEMSQEEVLKLAREGKLPSKR